MPHPLVILHLLSFEFIKIPELFFSFIQQDLYYQHKCIRLQLLIECNDIIINSFNMQAKHCINQYV